MPEPQYTHPFRRRASLATVGVLTLLAGPFQAVPTHAQDAWPDLIDANSYTFAANRLSFPSMVTDRASVGLSHIMQRSPPYAVSNYRLLFANFYTPGTAEADPETCPGNAKTVDFASILIGDVWYPMTFDGSVGASIADCGFVWSDPLRDSSGDLVRIPAGTTYFIRSSQSVEPGGRLTAGFNYFTVSPRFENWATGSGVEYGSSVQTGKRTGGRVAAYSGGSFPLGPAMAIGTGWDGSPVYLVTGDSIAAAQNDLDYTGAGVTGYIGRALDDEASTRFNFANLAVPGTRPTDQASTAPGQFQLRALALRSIPNRPFDRIITNMGNNSLALPPDEFQAAMTRYWAFLRELGGPHTPIYQTTYGPQTAQTGNSWYTSLAGQTASGSVNDARTGTRWSAIGWLRSGDGLPPYVTAIDVTSAVTTPEAPEKFRPLPGSWSLTEAVASGDGLRDGIELSGTARPGIGDHYVVAPGTADAERLQAYRVTGDGPWTVSFTTGAARPHSAGDRVLAAPTADGLHLGTAANRAAAAVLIERKRDGTLR